MTNDVEQSIQKYLKRPNSCYSEWFLLKHIQYSGKDFPVVGGMAKPSAFSENPPSQLRIADTIRFEISKSESGCLECIWAIQASIKGAARC